MPVRITLMKAVFDSTRVVLEMLTSLIRRTMIINIARTVSDANDIAAVIKNDFKIL